MSLRTLTLRIIFLFIGLHSKHFVTSFRNIEVEEPDGHGISLDVRFHIPAGKEDDCYVHEIHPGMVLVTDYQVIQDIAGLHKKIGFSVKDGKGQVLSNLGFQDSVNFKDTSASGGWYMMCFHNDDDPPSDKYVQFYISTYRRADWKNYTSEIDELGIVAETFTTSFSNVENSITRILEDLHYLRAREVADFGLLRSNNDTIYFWSLFNCMILVITGGLQVYLVRKLFDRPES